MSHTAMRRGLSVQQLAGRRERQELQFLCTVLRGGPRSLSCTVRCLIIVFPVWLLLVFLYCSPRRLVNGSEVRLDGVHGFRSSHLQENLDTGSTAGTEGDAAWRNFVRTAFSSDTFADNTTEFLWGEHLTASMTHVLSEIRKAGRTLNCSYDPALLAIPSSASRIFIASNLHNSEAIMPNFISQIVQFLLAYPERLFFVSIYESGSNDRTGVWLGLLRDVLDQLKVPNRIVSNGEEVRHKNQQRLDFLARVRNRAIEPLWSSSLHWDRVVFINDVFFCAQDIVRLLQHNGDIVCGMDFIKGDLAAVPKHILQQLMVSDLTKRFYFSEEFARNISAKSWFLRRWRRSLGKRSVVKEELPWIFYDIWVSHDLGGSQFINHPPYVVNDTYAEARISQGLPFQAQCCWNGLVVLSSTPFYRGLRFRTHLLNECATSECILICHDFQRLGFQRVLVDPGVRQTYSYAGAKKVYTDLVPKIPFLSWSEVLKSEPVQMRVMDTSDRVECCPLRDGEELVDWRDCYWYDIWRPNYTEAAITTPDTWMKPFVSRDQAQTGY